MSTRNEAAARALHASAPTATTNYLAHRWEPRARAALIAADTYDAEQGIHRVKVDDAAIERVARELWRQRALGTLQPQYKWESLAPEGRNRLIDDARMALTALTMASA